jgi:hypothetical protein
MPPKPCFLVRSPRNDLHRIVGQWPLQRLSFVPWRAPIQTSRSSSVVRNTGMALGWIGSPMALGCRQEAIDIMRSRYWLGLGAAVAFEFGHAREREERSIVLSANQTTSFFLATVFGSGA